MDKAPATLVAVYNAVAALIGYPQSMNWALTRRLEGSTPLGALHIPASRSLKP